MTFVGKILVIAIMAFSLLFLGISTVVFTTATNWKGKSDDQAKKIAEIQKKLNDAKCREIGEAVISGRKTAAQMARMFGVSPPTVSRIVAAHAVAQR